MTTLNLNLPFAYTYRTRMTNYRGLLGYFCLELMPLLLAAGITSKRSVISVLLLYVLWLNFYEIGYLFNDLKDRSAVTEINRTGSSTGKWYIAAIPRLLLALALVPGLAMWLGWRGLALALVTNVLLLLLLFFHSTDFVRRRFPGRFITFSALALYKYVPVMFPALDLDHATCALIAIFLFYGMARVLIYVLRKCGEAAVASVPNAQFAIQLGMLSAFSPLAIIALRMPNRVLDTEVPALWLYFLLAAILFLFASSVRRRIRRRGELLSRTPVRS